MALLIGKHNNCLCGSKYSHVECQRQYPSAEALIHTQADSCPAHHADKNLILRLPPSVYTKLIRASNSAEGPRIELHLGEGSRVCNIRIFRWTELQELEHLFAQVSPPNEGFLHSDVTQSSINLVD